MPIGSPPWHALLLQILWGTRLCCLPTNPISLWILSRDVVASRMLSTLAVPGLSYLLRPPTIVHFVFVFYLTSVIWVNSWNHPSSLLSLSKTALRAQRLLGTEPTVQGDGGRSVTLVPI